MLKLKLLFQPIFTPSSLFENHIQFRVLSVSQSFLPFILFAPPSPPPCSSPCFPSPSLLPRETLESETLVTTSLSFHPFFLSLGSSLFGIHKQLSAFLFSRPKRQKEDGRTKKSGRRRIEKRKKSFQSVLLNRVDITRQGWGKGEG